MAEVQTGVGFQVTLRSGIPLPLQHRLAKRIPDLLEFPTNLDNHFLRFKVKSFTLKQGEISRPKKHLQHPEVGPVRRTWRSCGIMWSVLLVMSVFQQGHAAVSYGRDFVTAFPENTAYYYPANLTTYLKITSLHDNTNFNFTFNGKVKKGTLNASQTRVIYLSGEVEEHQLNRSSKAVRVTSDNDVTVITCSRRAYSVQTNVVLPVRKLGQVYQIPTPNYTEIILMLNNYSVSGQNSPAGSYSQTYSLFRLLIINAEDKNNTVTVTQQQSGQGTSATSFTLSPYELIQMQSSDSLLKVTASANVSVLLTHPCLDTYLCKCSMVVHQLRPTSLLGDSFLVPPPYITNQSRMFSTSDQSVRLQYGSPPVSGSQALDPGSSNFLPFYQLLKTGFSNVSTSKPVSLKLVQIGSLIDLIPVFSACYLVQTTSNSKSRVLLIVETLQVQDLRLDSRYIRSQVRWNVINGTEYSWALVDIDPLKSQIMWHPSSTFGVYVLEAVDLNVPYGGPAISISEEPDPSGCAMTSAIWEVGNQSMTWQEALKYCTESGGQLASPSWAKGQSAMARKLKESGATGQVWIGLRRSLLTTEWYWQNGQRLDFSNWDRNQPANPEQGLCASVSMEPTGNYGRWSSARCCSSLKPVCYFPPDCMNPNFYA
ncbi:hypothetical protein NFI96_029161 [Prochilodus magdalenae]|nr:hypothetical protein NFI96_029161 [Prochilodus magdalenae]